MMTSTERFLCTCLLAWIVVTVVSGHDETSGCHWSPWELETPCTDTLRCEGQRMDARTRKCPDEEKETRDVPCDGKCRPCTPWSEWSGPFARRPGDTYGRERRYRDCFFAYESRRTFNEYRKALCIHCPLCNPLFSFIKRC